MKPNHIHTMITRIDSKCKSVIAFPACDRRCDIFLWLPSRDENCKHRGRQHKEDIKCTATSKIAKSTAAVNVKEWRS